MKPPRLFVFSSMIKGIILTALALSLFASARAGFVLPADRSVDWTQVGVEGGIPSVSTIYTNLTAIDNTGATDVSAAINAAIGACPSNQVVQLPAGVFLLSNSISMNDGVVLRGQGSNTVIIGNFNATIVNFHGPFWYYDQAKITSGFYKGSSNLVLQTLPADLGVGSKVQITESNDVTLVNQCGSDGCVGEYAVGQWVAVKAINGKTLTVWPPLYSNYTNTLAPFIYFPVNGSSVNHNFIDHAGLENLTLYNQSAGLSEVNIAMYFSANCWIKNIRSYWGSVCHIWTYDTYRCEIRDSLFSGVTAPITSSRCYGLQTGTPNSPSPSCKSSALLIENNIWTGCRGSIVLGYGAAGCVIGYNYFADALDEVPSILRADIFIHSAHPVMNLFEGNVGGAINADDFHGSSSDNTVFRNYWRGRDANNVTVSSLRSVEVDAWSRRYNVVGNVLGSTHVNVASMTALANPPGGALALAAVPNATWSYQNWYKALMFGYDGEGGGMTIDDTNSYLTSLITGNFNCVDNQTDWDTNGTQTLPLSLYHLTGQPAWWNNWGSAAWPPIGPGTGSSPLVSTIPAQLLYAAILNGTQNPGTNTSTSSGNTIPAPPSKLVARAPVMAALPTPTSGGSTNPAFVTGVTAGTLRNNYTGGVGFKFVVGANNLTVTDLGRWVVAGNRQPHLVSLCNSAGVAVASVTINTAGQAAGLFSYVTLASPVTLSAKGFYYLQSAETSGGDYWYDLDTAVTTTGDASIIGAAIPSAVTVLGGINTSYVPVSLKYHL